MLAEVRLPGRVQGRVGAVGEEELHLYGVIAGPVHQGLVHGPGIGRHVFHVAHAVGVLPVRGLLGEQKAQLADGFWVLLVFPVGLEGNPEIFQAFIIGIAVLNQQGLNPIRVLGRNAEAHRSPVVHHVHAELLEVQHLQKAFHDVRQVVEGVLELLHAGKAAVAVAGVVGGHQVVPVLQVPHQVPKHVGGGGEAVQQQDGGLAGVARFAVEDVEPLDFYCFEFHDNRH